MPTVETRGGSIRVKWWGGAYHPDDEGEPTKRKKYESASGPAPGVKFQTEQEAMDYGLDREYELRHGRHVRRIDAKTPMRIYCKQWLEAQELRPGSLKAYRTRLDAQIVPYWSEHRVGDITAWEYDAWKASLKQKVARQEMSHNYANGVLAVFRLMMTDAVVKYRLRNDSPVIEQKRRGRYTKKKRQPKPPLEMSVVHELATNAYHVWGYAGWTFFWTILFTGMRPPGEMLGLRREYASPTWPASDPDEERREGALYRYGPDKMPAIRVEHQLQYVDSRRTLIEPKYESHRTLVLPPFLHEMHVALLASHTSPWVFPAMDSPLPPAGQWHETYWSKIRDGAAERTRRDRARAEIPAVAGMAGRREYLLRHWHKEMLEEDMHPRTAQETRMGHEVAGVEGLYGNLTPAMERRIMEALQERWEKFMCSEGGKWQPSFPTPIPVDQ